MIRLKKNLFFMKYFYSWPTIGLCILLGVVTLWFYYHALDDVCQYPVWFPVALFSVNVLCLTVATLIIRRPSNPEAKIRMHSCAMFFLLIISPSMAVGLSMNFLSILWTLSIATYLLYCLLFIRYNKTDWIIAGVPFATLLIHGVYRAVTTGLPSNFAFLVLFGFLMSVFYWMFYAFFKFTLDTTEESLSVYLDNQEISGFLEGYGLTKREQEICFCIINGFTAKETGEKLFISEGTVKNHIKSIYKKMNIAGRMELMHLVWDFSLLKGK